MRTPDVPESAPTSEPRSKSFRIQTIRGGLVKGMSKVTARVTIWGLWRVEPKDEDARVSTPTAESATHTRSMCDSFLRAPVESADIELISSGKG
jgi:hypothetical protein